MKNSERPKKRRLNIADIIILIVAVLLLVLLAKFFLGDFTDTLRDGREIAYTVRLEQVDENISDLIFSGQTVTDHQTGNEIGTISQITITNSIYSEYDSEAGFYRHYEYPDLFDIDITITSLCKTENSRYTVNGVEIVAGKHIGLRTSTMYSEGMITEVGETGISAPPSSEQLSLTLKS